MSNTINIYGCGNMAFALFTNMAKHAKNFSFVTYTPTVTKAKELAKKINGRYVNEFEEFADNAWSVLCMKPQQFKTADQKLLQKVARSKGIISILAGTSVQTIKDRLNLDIPIYRIMPNTPSLIGRGVFLTYTNELQLFNWATDLLQICGRVFQMKTEKQFDQMTVISGSGPAYLFELGRLLSEKAETWGLDKNQAKALVLETLLGSAMLAESSDELLVDLRSKVTSKGGVTEKVLDHMTKGQWPKIFLDSLDKGFEHSQKM